MNEPKVNRLVELLEQQAAGSTRALEALQQMHVSLDDGYCLLNLHNEWRGAFSYPVGRTEALEPILEIARKLRHFESDDTLVMYGLPEWAALVALRGPAEVVSLQQCSRCAHQFVMVGTSGFTEANALVCTSCGNVHFRSSFDETNMPRCACGATFPAPHGGCQLCGSRDLRSVRDQSPYEYFATHPFTRGEGA